MKTSKLCATCQHKKNKCRVIDGLGCIKYLPCENTNFIHIDGVVETPPEVDEDIFTQQFINWIESLGYNFGGLEFFCSSWSRTSYVSYCRL